MSTLARVRRLTLGFGVLQTVLGVALTALSFITFFITDADRIRNSCPYWAGFTVCCSGAVGIIAWKRSSVLSMGLFTFFSAVCVVLQMIGTIFTGDMGGILKSVITCDVVGSNVCVCCDTISCREDSLAYRFEGITDCSILGGILKELMFGLCVLNIFGSLLCFSATVLGCTAVIQRTGRDQIHFRRHNSERSTTVTEDPSSWQPYSRDLDVVLSYAPPVYHSIERLQEFGTTPYIVPPPVFDPTDLPPPYSSGNPSLSNSNCSLGCRECDSCQCFRRESYHTSLYTHHSAFSTHAELPDATQGQEFLQARVSLLGNFTGSCNTSVCSQPQERDGISCREEGASVDEAEDILQKEFVENTGKNKDAEPAAVTADGETGSKERSVRFVPCGDPSTSKELIDLSGSQNACCSAECTSSSSPVSKDLSTPPPGPSLADCEEVPGRRSYSERKDNSSLHLKDVTTQHLQSQALREYSLNLNPHASELAGNNLHNKHVVKGGSAHGAPDVKCGKIKRNAREKLLTAPQAEFSKDKSRDSGQTRRAVVDAKIKTTLSCSKETIV